MILVTGGTGFIGSALVRALLARGEKVQIFDDSSRGARRRLSDVWGQLEFVERDVRDTNMVFAACEGCDEIVHLAFVNGTENFYKYPGMVLEVGVLGIINVLEAARILKVKKLLLVSSSEVYQTPEKIPTDETAALSIPDPYNPRYSYAAGKIISEMMALYCAQGVGRVLIARPHNVYGPDMGEEHVIPQMARRVATDGFLEFQSLAAPAVDGRKTFYGAGETRAFCYIDDAVEQLMLIRDKGEHRQIYNVGVEEETAIAALAHKIAERVSKEVILREPKDARGGTVRRCPDMTKLRSLGYAGPKTSLDAGLDRTLAWYLQGEKAA